MRLILMGYHDSSTKVEHRDTWQTPKYIFDFFNRIYEFDLDACASEKNKLCEKFISEEMDTLKTNWLDIVPRGSFAWMNPPYSKPKLFIEKAIQERDVNSIGCVMILPADTSVSWFSLISKKASGVIFLTDGRVSFISSETGKPKQGNNKGSMMVVFNPYHLGDCVFSCLSLKEIKKA